MDNAGSVDRGRRSANLTLDAALLTKAKALNVNLSRAAEAGIRKEVARALAEQWLAENRDALQSSNSYVDENGLPLGPLRPY